MPPRKRPISAENGDEESNKKSKPNRTTSDFSSTDFSSDKVTEEGGKAWNFKISTWNVDGLRAWVNKGGLEFFKHELPDVICLQETKCSEQKLPQEAKVTLYLRRFHFSVSCSLVRITFGQLYVHGRKVSYSKL